MDSRRSELLDHALWDNLERNKKQRIWRDKSVAERQAKRRRREDDEAMRPFAPSTSLTNALAGPSGLNNPITPSIPPPPPITPVPDLPAPPVDGEDEEMDDDRAEERAQGKGKGKGLGRIPKK